MLKFIKSSFRSLFEIVLWVVLITCAISGAVSGGVMGRLMGRGGEGGGFWGFIIGTIVGLVIDILGGGIVATLLNIDANIEKLVTGGGGVTPKNAQKPTESTVYDNVETVRVSDNLEAAPASTEVQANWNDAKSRCAALKINGLTGWRLPTKEELDMLYRNLKEKGLGDFSDDPYWSSSEYANYTDSAWDQRFWSSSEYANYTDSAWDQRFSDGTQGIRNKYDELSVRAVRAF